jgi:hypothetical protein
MGAAAANATEILSFGQTGTGSPITGTATGSSTTISAMDAPVTVTSCYDCGTLNGPESFTLSAHSIGPASTTAGGYVVQPYSGSFSITAGSENILSGNFSDAIFGSGTSLTLSVSDQVAGQTLSFTSSVIPANYLDTPKGMSLSFADVTPPVGITDNTLAGFTASVAGTFSASGGVVPEPATLSLLVAGMLGIGLARRRKH